MRSQKREGARNEQLLRVLAILREMHRVEGVDLYELADAGTSPAGYQRGLRGAQAQRLLQDAGLSVERARRRAGGVRLGARPAPRLASSRGRDSRRPGVTEGDPYPGRDPYPLDELVRATKDHAVRVRVRLRGIGRVRTKWV